MDRLDPLRLWLRAAHSARAEVARHHELRRDLAIVQNRRKLEAAFLSEGLDCHRFLKQMRGLPDDTFNKARGERAAVQQQTRKERCQNEARRRALSWAPRSLQGGPFATRTSLLTTLDPF